MWLPSPGPARHAGHPVEAARGWVGVESAQAAEPGVSGERSAVSQGGGVTVREAPEARSLSL